MSAPDLDLIRSPRLYAEAWTSGYEWGHRHGYDDGWNDREDTILERFADVAAQVPKLPTWSEVTHRRADVDRSDAAWDAYARAPDGQPVWTADARTALVAWCWLSWEAA